jgi:hypothetical protein
MGSIGDDSESRDHGGFRTLAGTGDRDSLLPILVLAVSGLLLPVFAWLHRPLSMRNYGEAALAALQGTWMLKPPFFYGSFVLAAGLLVTAGLRLWKR